MFGGVKRADNEVKQAIQRHLFCIPLLASLFSPPASFFVLWDGDGPTPERAGDGRTRTVPCPVQNPKSHSGHCVTPV